MSNICTTRHASTNILYDAEFIDEPDNDFFSCQQWQRKGRVIGQADGRGETCFFSNSEQVFALRHYRRGGLMAKLSQDRYLGLSLTATRAWKEWYLLQKLQQLGLPAPVPVAARVIRHGMFYSADLVTVYLPNTRTFADLLQQQPLSDEIWREVGACIRQFHQNNVYHSDLNAKNIMLDANDKVYLIDFDQCGFRADGRWKNSNLLRLKRSLQKFKTNNADFNFNEHNWQQLVQGYQSGLLE